MNPFIAGMLVGMMVGSIIGIGAMALVTVGKQGDHHD